MLTKNYIGFLFFLCLILIIITPSEAKYKFKSNKAGWRKINASLRKYREEMKKKEDNALSLTHLCSPLEFATMTVYIWCPITRTYNTMVLRL